MKKIILSSIATLALSAITLTAFAISTPENFKIDSHTQNSVTLSWDNIDEASAYSIYYSTTSGEKTQYELVENSPYTISNLEEDAQYFISISANDSNFEESIHSSEISFNAGDQANTSSVNSNNFALESIELISETKLKLVFNALLDETTDAIREFKIVNKFDDLDELVVLGSEIDAENKNTLLITMQESIPTSAQYNVTVVRLNDADGNNIENGVDGIESFMTPDNYEEVLIEIKEEVVEEEPVELESAGPEEPIQEVSGGSSGANISDADLAKTTESTAKEAEELPTTGAEHWFMAILALLLGAMMFGYRNSKA